MTSSVSDFNSQLMDFFDFMIKYCPDNNMKSNIVSYKSMADAAIKLNKLTIIDQYVLHVLQYEEKINSRDESFFLNELEFDNIDIDSILQLIGEVKKVSRILDKKKKDKIFDFMIVITYYARQYFNEKYSNT